MVSGGITPTPTYDGNGNQTSAIPATLTWNALNQPITVNSTTATYDALGRMVEKGVSGTYTQFVYNPDGTSLAVYSGGLTKGTISLPGGSTAVYNASGLNYIRHKDWLGSSRLATTWAHAVYAKEAYAPFGENYNELTTNKDPSFTGQDQNVVTGSLGNGVYDYLFRKYDPSAGRWLSPDPSGWNAVSQTYPQSLNRYAYLENEPMDLVDPQGLACMYAMSDGSVSVSNFGGDSGAEDVCLANGGNYQAGYLDPGSVSLLLPGETLPGAGYQGVAQGAGEIMIGGSGGTTTIMQANSLTFSDSVDVDLLMADLSQGGASYNPNGGCTTCHVVGYVRQASCDVDTCSAMEKAQWCANAKAANGLLTTATGGSRTGPVITFGLGLGAAASPQLGEAIGGPLAVLGMPQGMAAYTSDYIDQVCKAE